MRFLLLSSCVIVLFSCSSVYKKLQKTTGDVSCIQKFKPAYTSQWYTTTVDVLNNHLSGLLLFKKMPDGSTRLLFSNEMGVKFFDFEFDTAGNFKVHHIMQTMNKKAVIKTLRKDFELVLFMHTDPQNSSVLRDSLYTYYAFPQEKGSNYYITANDCSSLVRMERGSKKKPVVEAVMKDYKNGMPDTIGISHKNFKFDISLKRLENAQR